MSASKNSLIVSHTGYCTKAGDQPAPGSPLWSIGRALLGVLSNRLALGGVAVGSQRWVLPDGSTVDAFISLGIYKVVFHAPRPETVEAVEITYSPVFLYYEKIVPYPPYGYKLLPDGTLADRLTAYKIGEPLDPASDESRSITEQKYAGDSGRFEIAFGENPRYGNQYLFVPGEPPTVYSWWHSPFGDWPHIVFDTFGDLSESDMRYMPAYVDDDYSPGYYYITENPLGIEGVPVTLYKNGVDFFQAGQPGEAMIAGVGLRDDGDVLIAVVRRDFVSLSVLRGGQEIVVGTLYTSPPGVPVLNPVFQVSPWRFNDDATRVASICQPDPYNGSAGGLAVYEFTLTKNSRTGEYTLGSQAIRPIPGTVTSNVSQTNRKNTQSGSFVPPRGTLISGTTTLNTNTVYSDVNTTTVRNIPVAVYYDRRVAGDGGYSDNAAKLVIVEKTTIASTIYDYDGSNYDSGGSWDNMFPEHPYLSESTVENWSHSNTRKTVKNKETAYLWYVDDSSEDEKIPLYDFDRSYRYSFLLESAYSRPVLYTFYQANVCSPTVVLYSSVISNILNSPTLTEVSDHLILSGSRYQLRHFDARMRLLIGFKTTLDGLKERTYRLPTTFTSTGTTTRTHNCGESNATTTSHTEEYSSASIYKVLGNDYAIAENDVADYEIFDREAPAEQIPPQVILTDYVNGTAIDNRTASYLKVNGVVVSGSTDDVLAIKMVSNNVSQPGWASFSSPYPPTAGDWDYGTSTVTGQTYASWYDPEEFSLNGFKGPGSARSDPTQYIESPDTLSVASSMYKKEHPDISLYVTSERGVFDVPSDAMVPPDHVPASGVPSFTKAVFAFAGTRDSLHITDEGGTLYPIGWRFEEEEA